MSKTSFIGCLLVAVCVFAAPASFAADTKIAVVKINQLLEDAPQAKAALQRLEQEFAERDRKLMDEQKAVKRIEDKLARDGAIMSESERRKLKREIVTRRRELRRELNEFRDDRAFRYNEERGKLIQVINEAISEVGKAEDFDLILYEGIAFASSRIDLTKRVLEQLKVKSQGK